MANTESHIFSTGILRVGPPGLTPLLQDGTMTVGVIQDVTLDTTVSRHDLYDAAINVIYAVDTGDHEAKFNLKITTKDISRKLIPYTMGAVHTTTPAAGAVPAQDVYTIGGKSAPQFCRVEFDGVDTNGKNVHIVIIKAKPTGQSIALKLTDFADTPVEFNGYADQANNLMVGSFSVDQ